eukprot:TRINITY_DN14419_c0_g1_i1.p1 TRINITY_DN14419_c0_g1~~TRINITY_DN14419_c0_g1_i1.p1  ORF type:complete len:1104 (+),score=280.52 TRINITY_DN14419_c0_g1_i1:41-3313(+)
MARNSVVAQPVEVDDAQLPIAREGYLQRRGRMLGAWSKAYYVLRGNSLLVFSTKYAEGMRHTKRIRIPENTAVEEVEDKKFNKPGVFLLKVPYRDYFFDCGSPEDRAGWMDAIRTRKMYMTGLTKPPGIPLTLEALQGLAKPLFTARAAPGLPQYKPAVEPSETAVTAVAASEPKLADALAKEEWNLPYQEIVDKSETSFDENCQKGLALADYIGQFLLVAKAIGMTLIDEYHLPVHEKTVKPVALSDGDVAEQEELYICNGMLFRFPTDATGERDVPGADDIAMKIAGHELKGLKAYQEANIPGLHTALTCIVDHKGFRMIAIAVLPADGERTLVYGVTPSLLQNDFQISRMLSEAAAVINLKEHVVFADIHRPLTIHTGIEVQGHRCDDSRSYIINLARVFPADSPTLNSPEVLTALLRPEFVKKYPQPLSSDAFVNVGGDARDQADNDNTVKAASRHLQDVVIPEFVQQLDLLELLPFDSDGLTSALHTAGINVRYLGRIAELTRLPHVRDLCVVEMIARVCKQTLFRNLRSLLRQQKEVQAHAQEYDGVSIKTRIDMDTDVRFCVVDFFNLVLGAGSETDRFWYTVIVENVTKKFRFAINPRAVHRPALFHAMQHHCKATFVDEDQYVFAQSPAPLENIALVQLRVDTKHVMNDRMDCCVLASKGLAYKNEGQIDLALQALNLKLDLHKSLLGLHTMECSRILNALGSIYVHTQDTDHALLCANAALGAGRRFHAEAARVYNTLTEVHYAKGDFVSASECHQLAVQVVRWHLGAFHPLLLEVYKTMGQLYYNDKKQSLALECYNKCLELSLKVLGNNHPTTAYFYNRVGHVHRALNDLDRATSVYEKAMLIYQTVLSPSHPTTAFSYFYMAEALQEKGQYTVARDYAAKALNIREQLCGEKHPLTLNSYYQLALICDKANETATSVGYFNKILGYLKESSDDNMLAEIQNVTKSIIKLKFRALSPERQLILNKIRTQNRHFNEYDFLAEVVGELFDSQPSELVDDLFAKIAAFDNDAYMKLACITQLVEDDEVMLRSMRQQQQQEDATGAGAFMNDAASQYSDATRGVASMQVGGLPRSPSVFRTP